MRMILSLSALVLSVGASAAPPQAVASAEVSRTPALPNTLPKGFNSSRNEADSPVNCQGRIETARAERGLPKLDRDTAKPGEPLFIAAVDKRIDGCEVLVMRDNLSDIRPLPQFATGPGKLTPLNGQ